MGTEGFRQEICRKPGSVIETEAHSRMVSKDPIHSSLVLPPLIEILRAEPLVVERRPGTEFLEQPRLHLAGRGLGESDA